jgi:hypothetical protein
LDGQATASHRSLGWHHQHTNTRRDKTDTGHARDPTADWSNFLREYENREERDPENAAPTSLKAGYWRQGYTLLPRKPTSITTGGDVRFVPQADMLPQNSSTRLVAWRRRNLPRKPVDISEGYCSI